MPPKNFSLNLIKARLSETIIQQLFIKCGYSVFHYGMENAVPAIVGQLNNDNSEAALSEAVSLHLMRRFFVFRISGIDFVKVLLMDKKGQGFLSHLFAKIVGQSV